MTDRYKTNDGTVLDTATGLEWQAEVTGEMNWDEANEHAESLGNGWRLPTVEELATLIDYSRYNPATAFPNHKTRFFWSSSVSAGSASLAWGVNFAHGYVSINDKDFDYRVRCVRRRPQDGRFGSLAKAEARIRELEAERDELRAKIERLRKEGSVEDG